MRNLVEGNVLKVRAIGGLHVVTLAWDFVEGQDAKKNGLLGFAIERGEYEKSGKEVELQRDLLFSGTPLLGVSFSLLYLQASFATLGWIFRAHSFYPRALRAP